MSVELDDLLNEAIISTLRSNILNMYNERRRNGVNPNRISHFNNLISSRYYNEPPIGGYQVDEEHEYILQDHDDLSSLILLDITTRFGSPSSDSELEQRNVRKQKIKEIKYKKVKEETESECSICLDKLNVGEFQRTLKCTHCFHKKCIDRWFKKDNDSCPLCRTQVI